MRALGVLLLALLPALRAWGGEAWAQVSINGETLPGWTLVTNDSGTVSVAREDAASWRLPAALEVSAEVGRDPQRLLLQARPGIDVRFDEDRQILDLTIASWLMPEFATADGARLVPLEDGVPALMLNYDVQAELAAADSLAARAEAGYSVGRSLLTSSIAAFPRSSPRRLDTQWRSDFPEGRSTLVVGDTVGRGELRGSAFRYGGVQWSHDLSTTPEQSLFAMPAMRGVVDTNSTVDLLLNGTSLAQRSVPAGPFVIRDLPGVVGRGVLEMRIRDAFGQERRIQQAFIASPWLLREGLTTTVLEAGVARRDYALESNRYGDPFVAGTWRRGLSDRVTGEGDTELRGGALAARAGASLRAADRWVLRGGLAQSRKGSRTGTAGDVGLTSFWDFAEAAIQFRNQSATHAALEQDVASLRFRREWTGTLSFRLPGSATLSASHVAREADAHGYDTRLTLLSLSRSNTLGGSLSLQATRIAGPVSRIAWSLVYARRDAGGRNQIVQIAGDDDGVGVTGQVARDGGGRDSNTGWQASARAGRAPYVNVGGRLYTDIGRGDLEFVQGRSAGAARLSWHGGWLLARGVNRATAPLSGAVGLIEVPGVADVRLTRNGEDIGRTDANGRLVATHLQAFDTNRIRIDPSTLPAQGWVENEQAEVRPYYRGVVAVRFVAAAETLTARLRRAGGDAVPAGARARLDAGDWPVGDEGLISMPVGPDAKRLVVDWPGASCHVVLDDDVRRRARDGTVELRCE